MQTFSFSGSQGGIRTPDMVVNSHPLCRLSYLGRSLLTILLQQRTDIVYIKIASFLSMNCAYAKPDFR